MDENKTVWKIPKKPTAIKFDTNIIPKFAAAKDVYKAENEWGTWSCDFSYHSSYAAYQYVSYCFNHAQENTFFTTRQSTEKWEYIQLNCPKDVGICPVHIRIFAKHESGNPNVSCYAYPQGYNPNTNEWENLADKQQFWSNVKQMDFTIKPTTYYTKFRFQFYRSFNTITYGIVVPEIEIVAGKIKKITEQEENLIING